MMENMSIPAETVDVPPRVRMLARGATLVPVWRNGYGGLTFRSGAGEFIKYGPVNAESSMAEEAERLAWAARYTRVPTVRETGTDGRYEWLVTAALPGLSAVDSRWREHPAVAVRAVGEGLRALHDALPVDDCPFDWSVASRLARAAERGIVVDAALREPPAIDRLVVCHADACCPNTLLGEDGRWLGHVDLGVLGVADRWADIAVAAMSTVWNYGRGWEEALLDAYGVDPDEERMAYYRNLWNAT